MLVLPECKYKHLSFNLVLHKDGSSTKHLIQQLRTDSHPQTKKKNTNHQPTQTINPSHQLRTITEPPRQVDASSPAPNFSPPSAKWHLFHGFCAGAGCHGHYWRMGGLSKKITTHTPGNPPTWLWKESLYGPLVKVARGVFQRCVETTSEIGKFFQFISK